MSGAISSAAMLAYQAVNTDGTNGLTAAELKKGAALLPTALRQAVATDGADSVLSSMDIDGDGSLSVQELSDGLASLTDTTTLDALTKAQESQSQLDQFSVGLKSSLVSLLKTTTDSSASSSLGSTAETIVAAYAAAGKL